VSFPRVSVLTAVRNSLPFLNEAIESILAQTFGDFEYLVVDDDSTDDSWAAIRQQAGRDSRIRAMRNPIQLGAAETLNVALRLARGKHVAILDADDIALPERLQRQVEFLDRHPDYAAVGSAVRLIDATDAALRNETYPTHPASARWNLLFGASLLHSASLYRRELLIRAGGYSRQHGYLCDYELLCRLVTYGQIGNLPETLACYRRHDRQTSTEHNSLQTGQMLLLQYALQRRWLGLNLDLATFRMLRNWTFGQTPRDADTTLAAIEVLRTLHQTYVERTPNLSADDRMAIGRSCARRWARMAHAAYRLHPALSRLCWREARQLNPVLTGGLETRRWLRARTQADQPRITCSAEAR
jgi:glycosyltransferase involved in cell wall biosynthesis